MNNYEKMTLEAFLKALRAKKYAGATGARRAIGKAHDLSKSDKEKAHAEINKFFGVTAGAAPRKAAKKIQPKAKTAPKKAAKKIAAAPKSKAVPTRREPAVKRQPVAALSERMQAGEERVMRQHSAATVINTLHGKAPLAKDLEAKLLHQAALEYLGNASTFDTSAPSDRATPALQPKERIARPRVNVSKAETKAVDTDTPPESGPTPSNGASADLPEDMSLWTPEQRAQFEELSAMKAEADSKN